MLNIKFNKTPFSEVVFILLIAALYCGAIEINNHLLFAWLEDRPFRYWIYIPAGLKLFLIMMFGIRGFLGVSVGIAVSFLSTELHLSFLDAAIIGFGSGSAVLFSVQIFSFLTKIFYPWNHLKFYHIPLLAALTAVLNSLILYFIYRWIGLEDPIDWSSDLYIDISGRFIGTFLFIYLAIIFRKNLLIKARSR